MAIREVHDMKVLLDTNIVLDVLLRRSRWLAESKAVWQHPEVTGYISATTVTDIFYIVKKQTDVGTAKKAIVICLNELEIALIDSQTIHLAVQRPGDDFEDNVQTACAYLVGLDAIVTRNTQDFVSSLVPVFSPTELLMHLNGEIDK